MNNTLAAIQGNLYLAKNKMHEKGLSSTRLDNIGRLSMRAAEMVQQLLTFARKDMVSRRPFSLTSFMREEFKLFKSLIPENIDCSIEQCDEEMTIHGDATQLQQALVNLLNNARDAVRNTTQPEIRFILETCIINTELQQEHRQFKDEKLAHLIIRDNGSGISEKALKHIFEPFFTTKNVGEGTGLGLAMVYGSIQTHGGVIEIESKEGVGTTFHLYLPLSQEHTIETEEQTDAILSGEGETILLVDDDEGVRHTTGEVLESMGYKILTASDGKQGLDVFHANQNHIDVIISDVVMPNMGGVELARQARMTNRNMPIILVTGYDEEWATGAHNSIDQVNILQKPVSYAELSRLLRTLITFGNQSQDQSTTIK